MSPLKDTDIRTPTSTCAASASICHRCHHRHGGRRRPLPATNGTISVSAALRLPASAGPELPYAPPGTPSNLRGLHPHELDLLAVRRRLAPGPEAGRRSTTCSSTWWAATCSPRGAAGLLGLRRAELTGRYYRGAEPRCWSARQPRHPAGGPLAELMRAVCWATPDAPCWSAPTPALPTAVVGGPSCRGGGGQRRRVPMFPPEATVGRPLDFAARQPGSSAAGLIAARLRRDAGDPARLIGLIERT